MKNKSKLIFCALLVVGLQFGSLTGCVGYAGGGGVYYGGDPWFHGDVIVNGGGRGWYGHGGYVHPGGGWHR